MRTALRRAGRIAVRVPFGGTKLVLGPIWPLSLVVATWAIRTYYVPVLGASLSASQAWIATVVIIVAGVLSLLVHCAGHLVAARLLHAEPPARLPLYPSGDAAQAWSASVSPSSETWIGLAGPFANLAVAGIGYLAWGTQTGTAVNAIILFIVLLNVGLAGINLAPAFPLDGGRLIRAQAWQSFGSADLGTRLAIRLGWGLCLLLGGWAAFLYLQHLRFSTETSAITLAVALLLALELLVEQARYGGSGVEPRAKPALRARLLHLGEIGGAVVLLSLAPIMLLPTNLGMEAPGPDRLG